MEHCEIKNDILTPCTGVERILSPQGSKKGIVVYSLHDKNTGSLSREFLVIKCENHKNGMVLNHCPICGEDITPKSLTKEKGL